MPQATCFRHVGAWGKNKKNIFLKVCFLHRRILFQTLQVHQLNNQHRFSVNVWASIVGNYLIGQYLMHSLSGGIYETFPREVLREVLENVLCLKYFRPMWFQRDGARSRIHRNAYQYLNTTPFQIWRWSDTDQWHCLRVIQI